MNSSPGNFAVWKGNPGSWKTAYREGWRMHMHLSRAGEGCAASQEQWRERVCASPSAAAREGGDAFLRGSVTATW